MKFIPDIKGRTYSYKAVKYVAGSCFIAGVGITIWSNLYAIPAVEAKISALAEAISPKQVYQSESKALIQNPDEPDQIEKYYQEELKKLTPKYEQAHKDEAMTNAIERIETDLEKEKEKIRERAFLQ